MLINSSFKIFFISISLLSYVISSQEQVNNKNKMWHIYQSPSKELFYQLQMLSASQGFMGGSKIYSFENGRWKPAKEFQFLGDIEYFRAFSKNNIWAIKRNNTYTPEVYNYNGKEWNKKNIPFANQVTCLSINQKGIGWYGGVQELAYFDGKVWSFLQYPSSNNNIVRYLYPLNKKQIWILTYDGKLLFYDGKNWTSFFENKKVQYASFNKFNSGFALVESNFYCYYNSSFHLHSKIDPSYWITKVIKTDNGEYWASCANGIILKFDGHNWIKTETNVTETIMNLQSLPNGDAWAVGIGGIVLKYSSKPGIVTKTEKFNFSLMRPAETQILSNEEYGCALEDFNGDGLKDIFSVRLYNPNRLFMNKSASTTKLLFQDEAEERNATGMLGKKNKISLSKTQVGVAIGDIDNDGDKDCYLTSLSGNNLLLINNGNGYFRSITASQERATKDYSRSNGALYADFDIDGDLDLFVLNEEATNILFINNGSGYFKDVTKKAGLNSLGRGMSAAVFDADLDGDLDLYIANWAGENKLFRNDFIQTKELRFTEFTTQSFQNVALFDKTNTAICGDYNNDGLSDLFITNRKNSNRLYKNIGNLKFADVTKEVIGFDSLFSYSATFADFDNDGFIDLFLSNIGENIFYKNYSGKKFLKVNSPFTGIENEYNTGSACADLDNDGDVDIYSSNYINGESKIYINTLDNKNFLIIDLEGTKSNKDAIGTKLWLYKAGFLGNNNHLMGYKEIVPGNGYLSHSSLQVHFGTGTIKLFDLKVLFPKSGIIRTFRNIKAGTKIKIIEEDPLPAFYSNFSTQIKTIINDTERRGEAIHILIAFSFAAISLLAGYKRYRWNLMFISLSHLFGIIIFITLLNTFRYQSILLAAVIPQIFILLFFLLIHLLFDRIIIAARIKKEKDLVRDRIARDLHDDLASTISSSAIYVEALQQNINSNQGNSQELISKIKKLINDASNSIVDVVWMASSLNDNLNDLALRLRLLVTDVCKANKINHNIFIDSSLPSLPIKEEVKRSIYFAIKEVAENMAKHSQANNVNLSISYVNSHLIVSFADDGCGFDAASFIMQKNKNNLNDYSILHGNGLKNIYARANEIGAGITIVSTPIKGTTVTLKIKMT